MIAVLLFVVGPVFLGTSHEFVCHVPGHFKLQCKHFFLQRKQFVRKLIVRCGNISRPCLEYHSGLESSNDLFSFTGVG